MFALACFIPHTHTHTEGLAFSGVVVCSSGPEPDRFTCFSSRGLNFLVHCQVSQTQSKRHLPAHTHTHTRCVGAAPLFAVRKSERGANGSPLERFLLLMWFRASESPSSARRSILGKSRQLLRRSAGVKWRSQRTRPNWFGVEGTLRWFT